MDVRESREILDQMVKTAATLTVGAAVQSREMARLKRRHHHHGSSGHYFHRRLCEEQLKMEILKPSGHGIKFRFCHLQSELHWTSFSFSLKLNASIYKTGGNKSAMNSVKI